jgi:hypothetical protein
MFPPVDPTRRHFLSQAAGVAAGGTVLALATTHPAPAIASQRVPDPILEAIEGHRAAYVAFSAELERQYALEEELPEERRKSSIDSWETETKIVETDDPRWIDAEKAWRQASEAETDAAIKLVNVRPCTPAGILALLEYVLLCERRGDAWPQGLVDDNDKERSWYYFLIENIATALTLGAPAIELDLAEKAVAS